MTRVIVLLVVIALVALAARAWRRREGRVVAASDRFTSDQLAFLGVPAGAFALVEFTAPQCGPCVAARRVLDDVAQDRGDTVVVSVDLGEPSGDDLARAHKVLRTPTTFVVAPDGNVRGRVSGVPQRRDVAALVSS